MTTPARGDGGDVGPVPHTPGRGRPDGGETPPTLAMLYRAILRVERVLLGVTPDAEAGGA